MKVKDLMTTKVVSVTPNTPVHEVAALMQKFHFTGVPVMDGKKLVGIIAERDFITSDSELYLPTYIKLLTDLDFVSGDDKRLPREAGKIINAKAKDIMNQKVISISPDSSLEELAETFATKRINPVPVTDSAGNMVGIISRSDLIKLFSKKHFL
jgi:CBS domain-containing protein